MTREIFKAAKIAAAERYYDHAEYEMSIANSKRKWNNAKERRNTAEKFLGLYESDFWNTRPAMMTNEQMYEQYYVNIADTDTDYISPF